jgi:hypothetical protein
VTFLLFAICTFRNVTWVGTGSTILKRKALWFEASLSILRRHRTDVSRVPHAAAQAGADDRIVRAREGTREQAREGAETGQPR